MTEQSFYDTKTGNTVTARQVQHPGSLLLNGNQDFEDGDWVVRLPVDLEGVQKLVIFPPELFKSRFKIDKVSPKKTELTWDNYLDQVGFVPKKPRKRVVR